MAEPTHRLRELLAQGTPALAWSAEHDLSGLGAHLGVSSRCYRGSATHAAAALAQLDGLWVDAQSVLVVFHGPVPEALDVTDDVVRVDRDVPGAERVSPPPPAPSALRTLLASDDPVERLRGLERIDIGAARRLAAQLVDSDDPRVRDYAWQVHLTTNMMHLMDRPPRAFLRPARDAVGDRPWMHNLRRAWAGYHSLPYDGPWLGPEAGEAYGEQLRVAAVAGGRPKEAVPMLEEALRYVHPTRRWRIHGTLADAFTLMGDQERGAEQVQRCRDQARALGGRVGWPSASWLGAAARVGLADEVDRLLHVLPIRQGEQIRWDLRHARRRGDTEAAVQAARTAYSDALPPHMVANVLAVLLGAGHRTLGPVDLVGRLLSLPDPYDHDIECIDELRLAARQFPDDAAPLLHIACEAARRLTAVALPALEDEVTRIGVPCLGPYVLGEELGRGGAGAVYSAIHRPSGEPAAVKVLSTAGDPAALESRLRLEARRLASQDHAFVVQVFAVGRTTRSAELASGGAIPADGVWMAMERADGEPLSDRLRRGPVDDVRGLLLQLLEALAACHARDLVHSDLKPDNIVVEADGRTRLLDLGVARAVGEHADTVTGTPTYMAPEQWERRPADLRSDLYALGMVAHLLLTGHRAVRGTVEEVRMQHQRGVSVDVGAPAIDAWLQRLVARYPSDRFASAVEAAHALRAIPEEDWTPSMPTDPGASMSTGDATWVFDAEPVGHEPPPAPASARTSHAPLPSSPGFRDPGRPLPQGLHLLDARPLPLVGFEATLEALWTHLVAVEKGQGHRVVALVGDIGSGRRAVQRALTVRARELGSVLVRTSVDALTEAALDQPPLLLCLPSAPADLQQRLAATSWRGGRVLVVVRGAAGTEDAVSIEVRPRTFDELFATAMQLVPLDVPSAEHLARTANGSPVRLHEALVAAAASGVLVPQQEGLHLSTSARLTPTARPRPLALLTAQLLEPVDTTTWQALCAETAHPPVYEGLEPRGSAWVVDADHRLSFDDLPTEAYRLAAQFASGPYRRIELLVGAGDIVPARAIADTLLAHDDPQVPGSRGSLEIVHGLLQLARVSQHDLRFARVLGWLAWHTYSEGDLDGAAYHATKVLGGPAPWKRMASHAHTTMAFVAAARGAVDEATRHGEQAWNLARTPAQRADAASARARAEQRSAADIERLLQLLEPHLDAPARRPVRAMAAELALLAGDVERSVAYAQPTSSALVQARAMALYVSGRPEEAVAAVEPYRDRDLLVGLLAEAVCDQPSPLLRARLARPRPGRWQEQGRRLGLALLAAGQSTATADLLLDGVGDVASNPSRPMVVPLARVGARRASGAGHEARAARFRQLADDALVGLAPGLTQLLREGWETTR